MTTVFLRFPDADTFAATLPVGFELAANRETGAPLPAGVEAISIIGEIEQGDPPVALAGFHVNALGTLPAAWLQYAVAPVNPVRIFGGEA